MKMEVDRRERILTEAAAHFLRDGFERTTTDRIAASARVSKQAIYELFRDKEDLFENVIRAELGKGTDRPLPTSTDVPNTLEAFTNDLFEAFVTPRNYGLFRANLVATRKFPAIAAMLHERRRAASEDLARYLEMLAETGALARPVESPIDLATRLGGTAVEGTRYFLGYDLPGPEQRRAQVRLSVHLFLRGVRGAPDDPLLDPACPYVPPAPQPSSGVQLRLKPQKFAGLCDAAADEFLENGFDGASIDRITAATAIGRSTIYRQFGSKEGMFRHVIFREIESLWKDIAVPQTLDLYGRLVALSRMALDLHLEPRSVALHHLLVQESALFPDLARRLYDLQVDRVARPFTEALRAEGHPPPPPAALRAYHTLATFGVRYIANTRAVCDHERDRVSEEAALIILTGLKAA